MDWRQKLVLAAFVIVIAAIDGAVADTMVTGIVFCDQCKDGHLSLFDYPLNGIKVKITCADSSGQISMTREVATNSFGNYAMRFDGTPDLSNCNAQVSGAEQGSSSCSAAAGPAQKLRLMFRLFDIEMYAVDSLLSEPAEPLSFCPKSRNPVPAPATPTRPAPPVAPRVPPPSFRLPAPRVPPPSSRFPPLPPFPSFPPLPKFPPAPFLQESACPYQNWTMPEYKCYWRVVNPDSKVAVVFGPLAASRYGNNMTLWEALQGNGDPYKTLLREATTSLLNSYNSLEFPFHTMAVITHTNLALRGSTRHVLVTALRFRRANSGFGRIPCKFTPCK